MSKDKRFARQYSLNVARLGIGKHEDSFEVDSAFFQHFDSQLVPDGSVRIRLAMEKFGTHLDVRFFLEDALVQLPCDRCGELFPQALSGEYRIIYSFDEELNFEGYEVMHVDPSEAYLNLMQEFFDIIQLAIPIRKVPPMDVHLCAPEVLAILGLDEQGNPLLQPEEKPIDPRWEALRKLKGEDQEK